MIRSSRVDRIVRELDEGIDRQEAAEDGDEITEDDFVEKGQPQPADPEDTEGERFGGEDKSGDELDLDDLEDGDSDGPQEGSIDT
jgi:hypothetical protein